MNTTKKASSSRPTCNQPSAASTPSEKHATTKGKLEELTRESSTLQRPSRGGE
ncbi:MAG: hypothetical protein V3W41_05595 [Planctomycetota bacterium]